jgi:L-2,4-diaminobutyrate transaminase
MYGIEPDLITVAKGLTSAYVPLSAAIISEKVYAVMEQGSDKLGAFSHGYTYSGHPIGVAAANAVLDIVEREDLAGKAKITGAYLQKRMRETFEGHSIVGEVRGVGMLAAIEFVADPKSKSRFDPALKIGAQISKACRDRGLIARAMPHGDILGFAPPLIMSEDEVEQMTGIAKAALDAVYSKTMRGK